MRLTRFFWAAALLPLWLAPVTGESEDPWAYHLTRPYDLHLEGEVLLASHGVTPYTAPQDSGLIALSLDGDILWSADIPFASHLEVVENTVFAVGVEGVVGLDLNTGGLKWERRFGTESKGSPVATQGRVIVMTANGTTAVDPDGTLSRFYTACNSDPVYRRGSDPASLGDFVVYSCGAHVYALNASTLSLIWTLPIQPLGDVASRPAGDDEVAFVECGTTCIEAVDLADGKIRWVAETSLLGSGLRSGPAFDGERIFASQLDGSIIALNASDGAVVWEKDLPFAYGDSAVGSPLIVSGHVFAISKLGRAAALDPGTGSLVWERDLEGATQVPPVGGNAFIIAAVEDGIYRIDAATGDHARPLPGIRVLSGIPATMAIAGIAALVIVRRR